MNSQYEKDLVAVKQNGYALEYVENQAPELCLAAVKQDGYALQFVQSQTPEICLAAVKQNGNAIEFVENQTPELCLEAVKQDGYALVFVKKDKIPYLFHNVLAFEEINKYCSFFTEESWEKACLPFKSTLGSILFKVL
jgi:alanine racemase